MEQFYTEPLFGANVAELEAQAIAYRVERDGRPETPQLLRNVFQQWQDIGRQLEGEDDLRFGNDPD